MNRIKSIVKSCLLLLMPAAFAVSLDATARDETLQCTLYIATSTDGDTGSSVELKNADLRLGTARRGSFCIFADGRIADKQFVMVTRAEGAGATGSSMGYSVYTLENGDTISARFSGDWGSKGYNGDYEILGGSGSYSDATGDGTITGAKSPWATTSVVKIVLNVRTP